MTECNIENCERPVFCKGMCNPHYKRNWKYGNPLKGGPFLGEMLEWLKDHVDYDGKECLSWPFSVGPNGYACQVNYHRKRISAHRLMCILKYGPPPKGKNNAAHYCGCGHLACVNPTHIRWASTKENHADKIKHGTATRGEKHYKATITDAQALEIKRLLSIKKMSPIEIAQKFNVSAQTVYQISGGYSWSHLEI